MAASTDFLSFPPDFDLKAFSEKKSKICVVTMIGKSRFAPYYTKASLLNPVVDRDIFQGFEGLIGDGMKKGDVECHYDEDTQVLYLHLLSHQDTFKLVQQVRKAAKGKGVQDFYSQWQEAEYSYARLLLLVFSLSHIILLNHPTATFDMTYIKFFRILDQIRLKIQPRVCEMLREMSLSRPWSEMGRLCSPRVLFLFHYTAVGPSSDDDGTITSKSRSQKMSPLKRMQRNLEDQIYHVLRRARVITNISNNSLFAVPANQEYVFVKSARNEATEPNTFFLNMMRNHYMPNESARSKGAANRRGGNVPSGTNSSLSEGVRPAVSTRQELSFKEFLWQHVEVAFNKGFDDNVGRNPVPAKFELPMASQWLEVCGRMHSFLFEAAPEGRVQNALALMHSLLDPDMKFSECRCNKVIAMAEAAYQSELPPFYITSYHMSKLAQAKRVFSQYARGPAYEKYMKQLVDSCTGLWTSGRQQCEAVSLSGNLCLNQLHRALSEAVTEANKDLPVLAHSSQLKIKAACNCGRQQAEKDDPFDHRSANYDFYLTLEAGCCGILPHIDMPTFKAVSGLTSAPAIPDTSHVRPRVKDEGSEVKDMTVGMSTLSLALSLGQSMGANDLFPHPDLGATEDDLGEEEGEEEEEEGDHEAELSQGGMVPLVSESQQDEGEGEAEPGTTDTQAEAEGDKEEADREEEMENETKEEEGEGDEKKTEEDDKNEDKDEERATEEGEKPEGEVKDEKTEDVQEGEREQGAAKEKDATASASSGNEEAAAAAAETDKQCSSSSSSSSKKKEKAKAAPLAPLRQMSTTEYLPGMLHSNCPPDLLPKFPSWSLCCLDHAQFYSHHHGLDLPGFLTGSNFLLPWDLPLSAEKGDNKANKGEKERWPTINETKRGRHRRIPVKSMAEPGENSVRVYLGMEYECPRGHRFFCSGPDKVIKVLGNSSVKDTASRLLQSDMPLYTPCHLHTPKGYLAQLMRVYVVTPEGAPRVMLQPRVRPSPPPCPLFHPSSQQIELPPAGIWVLRLPHVYMGDNGPIPVPSDPQHLHACIALKGFITFKELAADG